MIRVKGLGYHPAEGSEEIDRQRRVWASKPEVRSFYKIQVFSRIIRELPDVGPLVEIGSGAGTFKQTAPWVIATDVIDCPWIDVRCTALGLPFKNGSIQGIAAINVLHHLPSIGPFLREAARVLPVGGRCICVEPWITPMSRIFYRWFHQEDCHPIDDGLFGVHSADDRPMHGNTFVPFQGLRVPAHVEAEIPGLRLCRIEPFSGLGWCLSKGFREGALLPDRWLRPLLCAEDKTNSWWSGWAGLNALLVFERVPPLAHGQPR